MEDPDELVPCPFEPVHMLQRKRMPYHIIKCRKNQSQKHFRVCPFNHRHVVHHKELEAHLQTCPDQGMVEREITHRHNLSAGITPIQKGYTDVPVSSFVPPVPSEDWDSTHIVVEVGEYNPQSSSTDSDSSLGSRRQPHLHNNAAVAERPVREPPQPRLPMNSGPMTEVIQMAGAMVQLPNYNVSPPRGRGRGRGHGFLPVKIGASQVGYGNPEPVQVRGPNSEPSLFRGPNSDSSIRSGLGRGKSLFQAAMETDSHTLGLDTESVVQQDMVMREREVREVEEQERRQREQEPLEVDQEQDEASKMKKRERKLKKMLRQILELEEKLAQGEVLDKDQSAKVSRKDDVLHELARSRHEEP